MTKFRSAAAWLVIFTQVWSPVLAQTLPITVDRSVSGPKPIVGVSNGVPVVNIAPPSAAGVSNNRFTQFNAGPSGVVLNNSGGTSQTQLAGQIAGNPMLGNQRAAVILNQVTAANPSRLMGMVEVAGQRANVIVANPAGITCDGCGFLNAGQATLTTGRPRIGADGVQGFDIAGGRIGIEGQGLYGDNLSRVDLLARTLEVNAKVWADRLNVVAGAAQVDYHNLAVQAGAGEGTAPAVALDVAALGGMYANSIRLIGTEAGLGVNVGGDLVAMTGDLQLSANGDVRIRPSGRLQATGNIAAQAGGDLDNVGAIAAGRELTLGVDGTLSNTGGMSAGRQVAIGAATLDNRGTLAAGLRADGTVGPEGRLQVQTSGLSNRGVLVAGGDVVATAGTIDQSGGRMVAGQNLTLAADGRIANTGGRLAAGNRLEARGQTLSNTDGVVSGERVTIQANAGVGNVRGVVQAEEALQIDSAGALDNRQGELYGRRLAAEAGTLNNAAGRMIGLDTLDVHVERQAGNAGGTLATRGQLDLAAGALANVGGRIEAASITLAGGDSVDNQGGQILADGNLQIRSVALDNRDGRIAASERIRIEADRLGNEAGQVSAGQTLALAVGEVDNGGLLYSAGTLALNGQSLNNRVGGEILAAGHNQLDITGSLESRGLIDGAQTRIQAGSVDNAGRLQGDRVDLRTGALRNAGGAVLASRQDMDLGVAALDNDGTVRAGQALALDVAGQLANAGQLSAGGRVDVEAAGLDNRGTLAAGLQSDGALGAEGDLQIRTAVLSSSGILLAGGDATAVADAMDISGGKLATGQSLNLEVAGNLANVGGTVSAGSHLDVRSQALHNANGTLAAGNRLGLQAGALGNAGGHIEAETAALEVEGTVDNRGGLILADNGLRIRSASIDNRDTLGAAGDAARGIVGGTVDLAAATIDNTAGRIGAGQNLEVATARLDNARGNLSARDSAHLDADSLRNDAGQISVGTTLALTTGALDNAGLLHSAGDLKLDARTLTNRAGGEIVTAGENRLEISGALVNQGLIDGGQSRIQAADVSNSGRMYGDQVGITTGDLRNATGAVLAARQGMALGVASLTNDGAVEAGRDLKLDVAGKLSNTGGLSAAGRIEVDAGRVENRGTLAAGLQDDGSLGVEGDLQIRTDAVSNSGILLAGGDASVVADTMDLSGGKLVAGQALTLETEGELRNVRGAAHGATVSVQAGRLDNAAGRIGSDGTLVLVTDGEVGNVAGTLAAGGLLDVQGRALDNTDGVVSGEGVSIRVNDAITNVRGVVQSGQQLDLSGAGLLDNRNGRVLADRGRIEAGSLDNRSGIVQADGTLHLISAGEVNNQRGELYGGELSVTAAGLDNSAGRLIGTESLDLIARRRIDNTDGTLAADGRLDVQTGVLGNVRGRIEAQTMDLEVEGVLDNRNGLILADNGLRIRAAGIDNRDTLNASAKGVMGGIVDLAADAIDNRAGRIGASQALDIVTATLDNIRGQVASNGRARIEATRLGNDAGLISAGTALTLATDRIDNQGRLHSGGDLTLDVRSLTNRASGEIVAAGVNRLNVSGALENQGLIDGGHTRIQAATVSNTGRLYGDRISIGASDLRNEPGAVIASRGGMDLGIGTLTNREHALIFADGDLTIGGGLDAAGRAAGRARSLVNASATIEATGHADIAAASIRNLNDHFESEVIEISRAPKLYYRLPSSTELMDGSKMWLCDQVTTACGRDPYGFMGDDGERRLLLPSEKYPESQYGPPFDYVQSKKGSAGRTAPIPIAYWPASNPSCGNGESDSGGHCSEGRPAQYFHANNAAIWAVFEMEYPGQPPVLGKPIKTCDFVQTRECKEDQARLAVFTAQMHEYDEKNKELDRRIRAFNADFNNRLVKDFFYYEVDEVVSESRTVTTDPGRIIAGGNMQLSGSVLNDKSTIIAGGTLSVDGPAIVNQGAEGERVVARVGQEVRTVVGRKNSRRYNSSAYNDVIAPERIELAAASTTQHAAVPASGQNAPGASNIAGASTSFSTTGPNVPGAQSVQVSGGPLAASIAKDIGTQGSGSAPGVTGPIVPVASAEGNLQASAVATGIGMSGVQPGPRAPAVVMDVGLPGTQTVRVVTLQPQVPQNAMYSVVQRPDAPYLIATDAQFTGQRQSLSSDFMLQQLNQDPGHILKRIGDGFYEQRLVAEQVMLATGQRFVGDYTDNEAQYKALLGAGVDFAHKLGLNVGTALTDEQLRHMTSDMVWLVEQTVTLPDGTQQQVLAPQVYLAVKPGDLRGDGTLIAGRDTRIRVDGDAVNTGTVGARNAVVVEAGNIRNTVGSVQGRTVNLAAREDIDNLAGLIRGDAVTLAAGRDVNLQASTRSQASGGVSSTRLDGVARIDAETLNVQAGRDFNAEAAAVSVAESARIQAGRDINLTTAQERYAESYNYGNRNRAEMRTATDMGTRIDAGSDLTLIAGRDVAAIAAEVAAGGRLAVGAERDITVAAGDQSGYAYNETYYKKRGFMSSRSVHTIVSSDWTDSVSSTFTGDSTVLMAGRDLLVAGSNVAAQHDLVMSADRNVAVTAAANSLEEYEYRRVKKSGFGALGGISYGSRRTTDSLDTQRGLHTGSTLGSVEGDVLVNAGASLGVLGSDILASKGDITLVGRDVTVAGLADTMRQREFHEVKQSGLTVTASNPVMDAMQTGMRMADAAGKVDNPVMQGLAGATTVLAASNAYDAVNAARNAANPGALSQIGGVSIKISLGSSQSSSTTDRSMTSNTGANVAAGRDLTVIARGAGEASDITVQGANLSAGRDAVLKAEGDIQLQAARNVFDQHTDSKSSGASIGVGLSFGGATNGLTLELGVNAARGRQDGRDVTWSNAHVAAGNTLALQSGGDISLQGASAKADRIIASVGGDLLLASLQEISEYTSRQHSGGIGVSICIPPTCVGGSVSANASTGRMDSDFESVTKQTGLWAGDGGFQIDVGGRTSLTGSVIASSDQAIAEGRNRLSTGTLETDDIRNKASYSASQVSMGGGFGFGGGAEGAGSPADLGTTRGNQVAGGASKDAGTSLAGQGSGLTMGAPTVVAASGSGSSTTRSAISEGEIEIRDEAGQQALTGQTGAETIAALDRDTSDTLNALRPIFDKEKIEAGFEIAGEFQRQAGQFSLNRAKEIEALDKKANDASLSREERALARSESVQLSRQWGPGGTYRQILMAVSAGAGGNVSGGVGQFAQAAAVNYLQAMGAEQVKLFADSLGGGTQAEAARSALHAIVGCAGAAANGSGSCGAGALGAGASSVLNALLSQSNSDSLSPQEKEAHGNLISSLVGAIGLGLGTDAVTAVVSARTETENNYLNAGEVRRMMEDLQGCRSAGDGDACRDEVKERYLALSKANGGSGLYGCKAEGESACNAQYSEVQEGNQLLEALERLGWSGAEYAVLDDLLELNWNDERIADGAWRQVYLPVAGLPLSAGLGVIAGTRAEAAVVKAEALGLDGAKASGEVVALIPGRVQSRINIANNRTGTTPLRESGNKAAAGFDHVLEGHFNMPVANKRSVFSIDPNDLKEILQSGAVVKSPVTAMPDGNFVRIVDTGRIVGTTTLKDGGVSTSVIKVITDRAGNLITTFPVKAVN